MRNAVDAVKDPLEFLAEEHGIEDFNWQAPARVLPLDRRHRRRLRADAMMRAWLLAATLAEARDPPRREASQPGGWHELDGLTLS